MVKVTPVFLNLSYMFVIQDKSTILVDTGCYTKPGDHAKVLSDLGVDPKNVSLIVLSHGHFDHCARVKELKALTGAPVICHKNAVRFLETGEFKAYVPRGEDGRKFLGLIAGDVVETPNPFTPDIVIGEDFDLAPYGVDGKLICTPGHSSCSISVVLASREAIIGDMILMSPFTQKPVLALLAEDEAALKASLKRLIGLADKLYGGHGGQFSTEDVKLLISE